MPVSLSQQVWKNLNLYDSTSLKTMMVRFPNFKNWKFLISAILPFLLLPITFLGENDADSKRYKCAYTILVMGIFWMLEVLPLAVTALFPIVFFPFLGIQTSTEVIDNYMKETQMMFIGGITLALALQASGLHRRIALRIMLLIGTSPWRLLLGILITTMLLSCVIIVNTAVAAMMSPIVVGLMESLDSSISEKRKKSMRIVFMLAVGYGANVGGTATIIGSQSALIYKELIEKENVGQNGKYLDLNFFTYSAFSIPLALINLVLIWLVLGAFYLGFHRNDESSITPLSNIHIPRAHSIKTYLNNNKIQNNEIEKEIQIIVDKEVRISAAELNDQQMALVLRKKYAEMGKMGYYQWMVLTLLSLAVVLWFTRDPQIIPGWHSLLPKTLKVGDSTIAIGVMILMFIIPRNIEYFKNDFEGNSEGILTWKYVHEHYPWSVLLIVGGGLAISDAADASGLSFWIGQELMGLESFSKPLILFILVITISIFTEFMSNTATISLITPILITLSRRLNLHPLYLSLPGAIACQYAFMLPTSNPPNAVVFEAGQMRITDMAKVGVVLNFICVGVLYLWNLTWGDYVLFNYREYEYINNNTMVENF